MLPVEQHQELLRQARLHSSPIFKKSLFALLTSLPLYVGALFVTAWLFNISLFFYVPALLLSSLFLLRTFVIYHDCTHYSLFRSQTANRICGHVLSLSFWVPYTVWKREHDEHHKTSGNLTGRTYGDLQLYTKEEYRALSPLKKLYYFLHRNPFVMLFIGPIVVFLIGYRIPVAHSFEKGKSRTASEIVNILLLDLWIALFGFATYSAGVFELFVTATLTVYITSAIGIFFFYMQHNFEDTYWREESEWNRVYASLYGASCFELPWFLEWCSGSIGYHQVHHLSAGIPHYKLHEFHDANLRKIDDLTYITPEEMLRAVKVKMWCKDKRRLVPFDS